LRLVARLDDVKRAHSHGSRVAAFAGAFAGWAFEHRHEQLTIRIERARVPFLDAELEFPFDRAGVGVHGAEVALFRNDINHVPDENG
jgi:hypothetical protein